MLLFEVPWISMQRPQKFRVGYFFFLFKVLCSQRQHLFAHKYSKNGITVIYYDKLHFHYGKAEISEKQLLQFSMSRDLLEIIILCWFGLWETFLSITNDENGCAA